MRIPVGSCEGCNQDAPLMTGGSHSMGNGEYRTCSFVIAELRDIPNVKLLGVFRRKQDAIKKTGGFGPIHWIGQAPKSMWLALREKDTN